MSNIELKYGLEDRPPIIELILYGLQWLAVVVPIILILGRVVADLQYPDPAEQLMYVQRLFLVTGLSLIAQVVWGHRLPLILGPATVLLVGIVASLGSDINAVYSSIVIGGGVLALLSISGLFGYLQKLFSPRVVATILVLIAFTITPTIINQITATPGNPALNYSFTLVFVLLMFIAGRYVQGIWKSTLIVWAIALGSVFYLLLFPSVVLTNFQPVDVWKLSTDFLHGIGFKFVLDPGVLAAFLICFLALSINDLGSIRAVSEFIKPGSLESRVTRGMFFTGILNVLSGFLGVIGQVNFSFSPGIIASTRVASRFTLLPTGLGLIALSFWPAAISFLGSIPPVVIASSLIYIMSSQIAAGLQVAFGSEKGYQYEGGLVMGLPFILSIFVSFLPAQVVDTFPPALRPVLGNGFVIGVLAVFFMEHVIYRENKGK